MAAGGFKEFVAGETLDEDEINDYLMQGMLVFAGTAARGSAIGTPVEGQFAFLTDTDTITFHDGSDWVELASGGIALEYVVVGAGGGGGRDDLGRAGGAGAGGYRSNVSGEDSGGGASAEGALTIAAQAYKLEVGAGGAGAITNETDGSIGGDTFFGPIISVGGGLGTNSNPATNGNGGGSGGGVYIFGSLANTSVASGVSLQGFAGGKGADGGTNRHGGGGGGASQVGANGVAGSGGGDGGDGVASSITGSSVTRAGGGGGASQITVGAGGAGGGGAGSGVSGTANTGGGGGGNRNAAAGSGGSGVVIFSVPTGTSVSFSGGVTESSAVVSGNDVYTVTAAGPTDTVTIG